MSKAVTPDGSDGGGREEFFDAITPETARERSQGASPGRTPESAGTVGIAHEDGLELERVSVAFPGGVGGVGDFVGDKVDEGIGVIEIEGAMAMGLAGGSIAHHSNQAASLRQLPPAAVLGFDARAAAIGVVEREGDGDASAFGTLPLPLPMPLVGVGVDDIDGGGRGGDLALVEGGVLESGEEGDDDEQARLAANARNELLTKVQLLKSELSNWRETLEDQVSSYHKEMDTMRSSLEMEVSKMREDIIRLRTKFEADFARQGRVGASAINAADS